MLNELDPTDVRILKLLQDNARLTHKEVADKLHLTATPIARRIRRLEQDGYIRKYEAVLDPNKIGRSLVSFTHVQLKDHSKETLNNFEAAVVRLPEVLECYHMTGEYDFILRVAVSDLEAYHAFLMNKLFDLANLGAMQSTLVMKVAKQERPFPIFSNTKTPKA
jgi:Lrp/AsnC family leucine-responsive transcriptional regulator